MLDERAWQVTAYVLKLSNVDAGPMLNAETAAMVRLAPRSVESGPKAAAVSSREQAAQDSALLSPLPDTAPLFIVAVAAAIFLSISALFVRRRGRR